MFEWSESGGKISAVIISMIFGFSVLCGWFAGTKDIHAEEQEYVQMIPAEPGEARAEPIEEKVSQIQAAQDVFTPEEAREGVISEGAGDSGRISWEQNRSGEEYVMIPAEDHEIPAVTYFPEGHVKYALVLLHGFGDSKEADGMFPILASVLAERYQIATLRIDFLGCGDSVEDYKRFDFTTGVADALCAERYFRSILPEGTPVGLLGHSMGGTIAMLTAGRYQNETDAVIAWAGAVDLSILYTESQLAEAREIGYYHMILSWRDPMDLGLSWFEDVESTDVLSEFSAYAGPVYSIVGTADDTVGTGWAEAIAYRGGNPLSSCTMVEGADHVFNVEYEEDKSTLYYICELTGNYLSNLVMQPS